MNLTLNKIIQLLNSVEQLLDFNQSKKTPNCILVMVFYYTPYQDDGGRCGTYDDIIK